MSSDFSEEDIVKLLKELEARKSDYPSELLAARRATFMDQVTQRTQASVEPELLPDDRGIVRILQRLKSYGQVAYPIHLFTARRAEFKRQVALAKPASWFQRLRAAIEDKASYAPNPSAVSSINLMLTSLIAISFVAFVGLVVFGNLAQHASLSSSQNGFSKLIRPHLSATPEAKVICKPGYAPPLCLARAFYKTSDLTYPGNGARPAVAKDTLPGYEDIHDPAFINDGLYGPGASWISNSPNSWVKIDLGKETVINTISFGRDRLGKLNDHDPGQFVVAVALSDDVYANGNSSNDDREYTPVFDSKQASFDGKVSGAETIQVQFEPRPVRYIKITFENAGAAVDEVEAFMLQPTAETEKPAPEKPVKVLKAQPTHASPFVATNTSTPVPTSTPLPTHTSTPIPTHTPLPTNTPTDVPPTDTPTPVPTDTPIPTDTPTPIPTDTPTHVPTDTPIPTDTEIPIPTDTPVPTETPLPIFTDTPFPTDVPTDIPINDDSNNPHPQIGLINITESR